MKDELQHVTQGEQLRGHDIVQVRDYKSPNYVGTQRKERIQEGRRREEGMGRKMHRET